MEIKESIGTDVTVLMISFLVASIAGAIGWAQRARVRTRLGCLIASANCGVVGLLGSVGSLEHSPGSYLRAFFVGLSMGWIAGRFGMTKWPEAAGLLIRVLSVLKDTKTNKSE